VNLFKSGTNNLAKVLSAAAALFLWFHVTIGSSFTTTLSLPIQYIGPAKGLMIAGDVPDHVSARVRGTGRSLLAYSLQKHPAQTQRYVLVNLNGLPSGKHPITIHTDQVNMGAESLDVERITEYEEFTVAIDLKIQRSVSVDTDSIPGLRMEKDIVMVKPPDVEPRFVTIEGPENVVRAIHSIPIHVPSRTAVSLQDTLLTAEINVEFFPFVTVNPKEVRLHFEVEPVAERVIDGIPVRLRDFPRQRFSFEPATVAVTVRGAASVIARLASRDISVNVPYRSFLDQAGKDGMEVKPDIVFPKGITDVTPDPETVRITPRVKKK
jgi:hypothetical protein